LIAANVFNIGADLGGMVEATEMVTGIKSYYWTPIYTILIISLLFFPHTVTSRAFSNGLPSVFSLTL
jgi:hypothetical protein